MGMNDTPVSERAHIAFFGCRNAGKSSLLNAVTGQQMAVVSAVKGTTTDPVYKTMELLPAGPVVIIDTPGLDDDGEIGSQRIGKALQVLRKTDVAVIVIDGTYAPSPSDEEIIRRIKEMNIPYLVVYNKADLISDEKREKGKAYVSALSSEGIFELKQSLAVLASKSSQEKPIIGDLVKPGDLVVLVVPIDKAAPKGRLILPQQQVIRDLLENACASIVVRETELQGVMDRLGEKVALVITDSQAFGKVAPIVPESISLTSFSILFSRYKGELIGQLEGLTAIDKLCDSDTVLISEGCTHHRQCGDIGYEKIPALLKDYTGKKLKFEFSSGQEFPDDIGKYKVIIHCGGCMLTEKEMKARIAASHSKSVPITNFGMVLAMASGILNRSVKPLGLDL